MGKTHIFLSKKYAYFSPNMGVNVLKLKKISPAALTTFFQKFAFGAKYNPRSARGGGESAFKKT